MMFNEYIDIGNSNDLSDLTDKLLKRYDDLESIVEKLK